uniref:Lysosomal dipeptide transporter MFSD1 n=1 Tax=Phaeocystis antarctica TaxID=33657 RepID=A0A7S0HMB8_9EUKA|mmetsp:Transcript_31200/g.73688  ORF Transcript_31200/g.73688 Transcript_31200/m.73688 type:complete len:560 (+) Transcript_31200:24-1703(+)
MAQEARHPFRLFGPGKKRLNKNGLSEPFLSPGGSVHTTEAIEKSKLPARWLVLMLLSLLMIGNYYCYDNPAALYSLLAAEFSSTEHFDFYFDGLYSVYSFPNIVLPLVGGMIVDRWGVAKSLCLFTLLILLGQAIFAAACSAGWLNGMLLGRAFFGLGGESLSVAQSAFVTQWFQTKELAFALGITLSVARFGSVLNNALSPWLAAHLGSVASALWVGVAVCGASLVCALALGALDSHHSRAIRRRFKVEAAGAGESPVACADVARFGRPFWLLAGCCVVVYGCVLPFNNVASALLQDRDFFPAGSAWVDGANRSWVYEPATGAFQPPGAHCSHPRGASSPFCLARARAQGDANWVMSEPFLMSAVLTPVLGHLVDNRGGRATLCLLSALACLLVHLLLGLTALPAKVLLLGLGLGYSVFAAVIWPSVAYVVDSKALGTAYGVVTSLQNFGLFAIPLLVGAVHEATLRWQPSYLPANPWSCVELVFATQAALGVAAALGLNADPLVRLALNSPTGRLPDGHRIFVQDGWQRSPDASRHPSPLASPLAPAGRVSVGATNP